MMMMMMRIRESEWQYQCSQSVSSPMPAWSDLSVWWLRFLFNKSTRCAYLKQSIDRSIDFRLECFTFFLSLRAIIWYDNKLIDCIDALWLIWTILFSLCLFRFLLANQLSIKKSIRLQAVVCTHARHKWESRHQKFWSSSAAMLQRIT